MAVLYSDINSGYKRNTLDFQVTDMKDIILSLDRLFHTKPGDNPFNRDYGSSLHSLLFESSGNINLVDIKVLLTRDIERWEPRVQLSPLDISIDKLDDHTFNISCVFTVPTLNNTLGSLNTEISNK